MVLRNSWLPAACLPRTYDLAKYCGAILCPRGMSRLDDVADIRMCSSCQKPLMAKTVQQPKDAMANFQYFAHAELPQGGSRWFRDREYFGVNACRATVVTHHYQTKRNNLTASFSGREPFGMMLSLPCTFSVVGTYHEQLSFLPLPSSAAPSHHVLPAEHRHFVFSLWGATGPSNWGRTHVYQSPRARCVGGARRAR